MSKTTAAKLSSWLWPVLCLILAALVLYVSYQNRQLRNELESRPRAYRVNKDSQLSSSGFVARPFEAFTVDGDILEFTADSAMTPFIFGWYSDECEACYFARDAWNILASEFPDKIWVLKKSYDIEPDSLFFGEAATFPMLAPADQEVFGNYHIDITPQTMIVEKDGTVRKIWAGAVGPGKIDEIISYMHDLENSELN